jgi:hypothetical protein
MARPSTLTRLIHLGIESLTDPSVFTEPRKFWRNGPKGHLHAEAGCYKFNSHHSDNTVTMSFSDATRKKACSSCWEPRVLSYSTSSVLGALLEAGDHLDRIEMLLDGKRSISDSGAAIESLHAAREALKRLNEDAIDLVEPAYQSLQSRISETQGKVKNKVESAKTMLPGWAAASLLRHSGRDHAVHLPGVGPEDVWLYGHAPAGRGDYHIVTIFNAWCNGRRPGPEKALANARQIVAEASLSGPGQLCFPVPALNTEVNLQDAVTAAWRTETETRLTEKLIPAWEKAFQEYAAKQDSCIVGISNAHSLNQDGSHTIIDSYPHARGRHGEVVLQLPEVLAMWLVMFEHRWGVEASYVKHDLDTELLETVAALWQPGDNRSEFRDLETAVNAAGRL